jgi:dipeptidyl aminopeptidase/acylaminoacyl peptidase
MSYWKQHIGDPYDSALAKKSPINSVAAVTIPVLIVYSTDDAVIPIEQSQKMAQALSAAGKSVSVVALRDEDHWLSRTETRVQLLKELDDFLKAHL